ncbi:DEAD-domain-containing protein [Lojkania enalia]|uniref:ATP-dependent RNA helicase n=1 Tax=Lojkania enalia TaxID=147567 RepID=A0A9P4K6I6_9PLEO|nr:DEAD-domain-containing protein [Didymosphaeria enalia]
MLAALRRCPASLSRALPSAAISPRILPVSIPNSSIVLRVSAPRVAVAAFHQNTKWQQTAVAEAAVDQQSAQDDPVTKFKDLAIRNLVHPNIVNTITKQMRLDEMTEVQSRTINEALSGVDVIAQAKTGTGKTLGFLIPTIQRIIAEDPSLAQRPRSYKRARPDDIRAIIISPTRELAEQIAVEAQKLTQNTGVVVQTAVGGTQKRMMLMKTQREGCHLLIGTPGRLKDILSDPTSRIRAPRLNTLVMDEADRLLDQGFTEEIEEIKLHLPDPSEVERQTMMFSATVPREVVDLVRRTLKPGFHFAQCVNEDEEPTHHRVPQKVVHVTGFENITPTLYELFQRELQEAKEGKAPPFKAIVYFNSTAEVTLAASVFYKLSGGFKRGKPLHGLRAYEIHSKLTQAQRTRSSDDFRFAQSAILFSSDVTARGMDFPNVTHVIQVGLPRDRESYIHRIGRTGRAGKEGEGWLIVSPFERSEIGRRLRKLPINEDSSLETARIDMTEERELPENIAKTLSEVTESFSKVYPDQLDAAFRGMFGSFQWVNNKQALVDAAHRLAEFGWGMPNPPPVPASVFSGGGGRGNPSRGYGRPGSFGSRDRGSSSRSGGSFGRRSDDRIGDRRSRGGFGNRGSRGGFGDRSGGFGDRRAVGGGFGGRSRMPDFE